MFFEDEGRFGRINTLGACWVPGGSRAIVPRQLVREYTHAYCALCPETGENFSLVLPDANTESMDIFMNHLSRHYPDYRIILAMDGASNHTAGSLERFENIAPLILPPGSPELNPAEHIWDYLREQHGFINQYFEEFSDVEDCLEKALENLYKAKEKVKSMTLFPWIISP